MTDLAYELRLYQFMLADFADYVISDVVYWQLREAGSFWAPYPKLTIGGILLQTHKLRHFYPTLSSGQQKEAHHLFSQQANLFEKWQSNLHKKALHELQGRFKSWQWFLEDLQENPRVAIRNYRTEVNARVYLHLLLQLLQPQPQAQQIAETLQSLDHHLRQSVQTGKFVWESDLQPAFPAKEFWFLYLGEVND
jgi:hypothetical protein